MNETNAYGGKVSEEIEVKFDAPVDANLPEDLTALGLALIKDETFQLKASYFDTADNDLANAAAALRKRSGGDDDGWHIKQRSKGISNPAGNTRSADRANPTSENVWPLEDEMPAPLGSYLRDVFSINPELLEEVAILRTVRRQLTFEGSDASGTSMLLLVVDDQVSATDTREGMTRAWREWECELQAGPLSLLGDAEVALVQAGATRSQHTSKIAKARGIEV